MAKQGLSNTTHPGTNHLQWAPKHRQAACSKPSPLELVAGDRGCEAEPTCLRDTMRMLKLFLKLFWGHHANSQQVLWVGFSRRKRQPTPIKLGRTCNPTPTISCSCCRSSLSCHYHHCIRVGPTFFNMHYQKHNSVRK